MVFANLGERIPDPMDMQKAMCPRKIPPASEFISPRLVEGKSGVPRRERYAFLLGQGTRFLSSDTMAS